MSLWQRQEVQKVLFEKVTNFSAASELSRRMGCEFLRSETAQWISKFTNREELRWVRKAKVSQKSKVVTEPQKGDAAHLPN